MVAPLVQATDFFAWVTSQEADDSSHNYCLLAGQTRSRSCGPEIVSPLTNVDNLHPDVGRGKPHAGRLVVGWVTNSEVRLLCTSFPRPFTLSQLGSVIIY